MARVKSGASKSGTVVFPKASSFVTKAGAEGGTELLSLSPSGAPPARRLKDVKSAHEIYKKYREADQESARQRHLVQEMYNGALPYDQSKLKSLGQGHRFNLNFGEGAALKEAALTAYNDLTDSVDCMVRVRMKPGSADPSEVTEKQEIISQEYHAMQKRWPQFNFNVQLLADIFVGQGVGFAYRTGDVDWKWEVTGLGDFLFSRQTKATETAITIAFAPRKVSVSQLYKWVADPVTAKANGWNREEVLKAIVRACQGGKAITNYMEKIEEFENVVKNNDLYTSEALADMVTVNHIWVQEFDGTISHYLYDESGQGDDFFFVAPSKFDTANQCFTGFTFGVGNGFYHGIRGQGYKIYPQVQASNRLRCGVLDSMFLSLSLLVQTEDADDLATLSMVNFGAVTALPPELRIQQQQFTSRAQEALAVVQDLSIQIQNHTGSYKSTPVDPTVMGRDRVTKAEVLTRAESQSVLNTAAMNLFYQPWQRLHQETYRRVVNEDYHEGQPGFEEVQEFRDRCRRRGVSLKDLQAVEDIEVVRAIGAGSASLRRMMIDELMQYIGSLDPVGQNNLLRDKFAQNVGYGMVDRYIPRIDQRRPILDERLAELENADMRLGQQPKVGVTDVHLVHAQIHLLGMQETVAALQNGQTDPQRALQHLGAAVPHTDEHLAALATNQALEGVHAGMAQMLNQFANLADQLAFNIREEQIAAEKAQRDIEVEMAAAGGGEGGVVDAQTQARVQSIRDISAAKIQAMQAEAQVKLQNDAAAMLQKRAIDDLKAAQQPAA